MTSNGWQSLRFDQMARLVTERVDPAEAIEDKYVGLEHIDPQDLTISRWGHPSDVKGTKFRVRAGQIIFGKRRFYQRKVAIAPFDCICSAHAMVLEERPTMVAPGFLAHFMLTEPFVDRALKISEGSLSPTIRWKRLAAEEFELPPINRQYTIVRCLNAVETARHATYIAMSAAITLRTAVTESWFSTGAFQRLDDLGDFKNGLNKSKDDFGFGTRFVNIADVYPETLDPEGLGRMNCEPGEIKSFGLQSGDILIDRSSVKLEGVGYPTLFSGHTEPVVFGGFIIRFRPGSKLLPEYAVATMRSPSCRRAVMGVASVSANVNVSQQSLGTVELPVPPLAVQRGYAEHHARLSELIAHAKQRLDLLAALRSTLSATLLSGAAEPPAAELTPDKPE